jgi:hypothetical protein
MRWITQSEYHSWNSGVSFRKFSPGCSYRISLNSTLKSAIAACFFRGYELNSQKARHCTVSPYNYFHTFPNYSLLILAACGLPVHLCSSSGLK